MARNKNSSAEQTQLNTFLQSVTKSDHNHGFATFLDAFWAHVPPNDKTDFDSASLFDSAYSLWQFGQLRKAKQARVRVHNPASAHSKNGMRHTAVEIVTDDMPFLVDSITNELQRMNLGIYLTIYPMMRVVREKSGRMIEASTTPADGSKPECYVVFWIDRHTSPEQLALITSNIERVLEDVRRVVNDWQPMQQKVKEALAAISATPRSINKAEKEETAIFLQWLLDKNFIFMGYREYRFGSSKKKRIAEIDMNSGLGLMRDPHFILINDSREADNIPAMLAHLQSSAMILISKGDKHSTVHRASHLDRIGIKMFDSNGEPIGERLFAGLFTSRAYSERPSEIPFIRQKAAHVIQRANFPSDGHNGKALVHILETYPRDELFQASEDQLYDNAIGILNLQERKKTAAFLRKDTFDRFIAALIYFPRDRFNTSIRHQIEHILEEALGGKCTAHNLRVDEGPLAQLYLIISRKDKIFASPDMQKISAQLTELSRGWLDRLQESLILQAQEEEGWQLYRRYADAFPTSYQENTEALDATQDIFKLEEVKRTGIITAALNSSGNQHHFKVYHPATPVPLSDVLPMLENLGLKVISTTPYQIRISSGLEKARDTIWLHDFLVEIPSRAENGWQDQAKEIETAFVKAWRRELGTDLFNALILHAHLNWREVFLMRMFGRYLRQTRLPYSQLYVADVLRNNPNAVRLIVDLFHARNNPQQRGTEEEVNELTAKVEKEIKKVSSLDEDRILKQYLNLVQSTLRTNYYQTSPDGQPKSYVSLRFNSRALLDLPLPRPYVETFIYSPRVEAIHLRTSKVARGGIRWSDRREDYRDEVLGLMKAQNVKNSIIVPSGAKGGFYCKQLPENRDDAQKEAVECYRIFVRSLLDITDNLADGKIVPPENVVCHDEADPYLVVAADKGTATFSDTANEISKEYGHWLGDAFASGGSAGYDHKGMGITARGTWESVKRHFREIGKDIQKEDFTVIGVGDMAGDVFGNGMLLSEHVRLLGAFNHSAIFCDPNPDAAKSFAERKRLFDTRGQWQSYDPKALSKGGRVFERKEKILTLTPEIKACFGIETDTISPSDLIRIMLKSPAELLWLGGIGTYVKAATETDADVLDKANDALRINGSELRCAVVGEGANLGFSQLGRIEYARSGGRINTDFIDNSAGVDTSDHEVNIKILFSDLMRQKLVTLPERDKMLAQMTDDVAALVLKDNYQQTQSLTVAQTLSPNLISHHAHFIEHLERLGQLNRKLEYLPSEAALAERRHNRDGLTRPELSILLSYAKLSMKDALIKSDLMAGDNDDVLKEELLSYFPARLRKSYAQAIVNHSLRQELIVTSLTTAIINRLGISFPQWIIDRTGCSAAELMRAFLAMRNIFDLNKLWHDIEALDGTVPATVQTDLFIQVVFFANRILPWLLRHEKNPMAVTEISERYQKDIKSLNRALPECLTETRRASYAATETSLLASGVPDSLAGHIASLPHLGSGLAIARLAEETGFAVKIVARTYFQIADRFRFDWLQEKALLERNDDYWQRQTQGSLQEDFLDHLEVLARRVLMDALKAKLKETNLLDEWLRQNAATANRMDEMMAEFQSGAPLDLALLSIINRRFKGFLGS